MPLFGTIVDLDSAAKAAGTPIVNNEFIAGSFKTFTSLSDLASSATSAPDRFITNQIVYISSSNELLLISKSLDESFNAVIHSSSYYFPTEGGGGGTPGGSPGEIQFNDGGAFGGDPRFIFEKTTGLTTLSGSLQITGSTDNIFLIRSGSIDLLRVSSSGAIVFGDLQHTPPPVAGGFFYSSSAFYVGVE